MQKNLTEGNIFKILVKFSVPYLISCFLQTLYGLADLFIVGQFNDSSVITAVSVGSQIMHMLTVMITGLAMGAAAHGIGTARSIEEGATEGALSGLAMALMGVVTALLTPIVERYLF